MAYFISLSSQKFRSCKKKYFVVGGNSKLLKMKQNWLRTLDYFTWKFIILSQFYCLLKLGLVMTAIAQRSRNSKGKNCLSGFFQLTLIILTTFWHFFNNTIFTIGFITHRSWDSRSCKEEFVWLNVFGILFICNIVICWNEKLQVRICKSRDQKSLFT